MLKSLILLSSAIALLSGQVARAADAVDGSIRTITVPRNKSAAFRLDQPATQIVVSQPETAEIVATTDHSFYVRGKQLGSTNLLIYGPGRRLTEVIDVRVGFDAAELQADLASALPNEMIEVRGVGEGLLLTGDVSTTGVATKAKALAERYAPKMVSSAMTVRASQQIVLEVRIIEANRSALQEFGIDMVAMRAGDIVFGSGSGILSGSPSTAAFQFSGSVGQTSFDIALQALEEKGITRTLARPNLTALSGEKASFLAGGEFPYPIPQGVDQVTVEFRPYGVRLEFEPEIQDNGLIRLKVAPEVSQIDTSNSVRLNNFNLPALTIRRTSTTVELREGESFAIAGLFQQDYVNAVRQVPALGDVPILGALFKSSRWRKHETELVIIVTPRLATAGDLRGPTHTPISASREPTAIDLILMGAALDQPLAPMGALPQSEATQIQ